MLFLLTLATAALAQSHNGTTNGTATNGTAAHNGTVGSNHTAPNTTYSTVYTQLFTTTVPGGNISTFGLVISEHDTVPVHSRHITGNLTTHDVVTASLLTTTHKGKTSTHTVTVSEHYTLMGNTTVAPVVADRKKNAGSNNNVGVLLPIAAVAACLI